MANTPTRLHGHLQGLYETAMAATSLKGVFVGIYEYACAIRSSDLWDDIAVALDKLQRRDSKDTDPIVLERFRETTAWYAWVQIDTFKEVFNGNLNADANASDEFYGDLRIKQHEFELSIILGNEAQEEDLARFRRDDYKGYLMRFHRWLLETFPPVVGAPRASALATGPMCYERSEQGYKQVINVGEVQVALQQGTKKSKFLETLMDANGDEVTYEQMAEDLNETKTGNHAKLQLWRKYDQQYYGINNSFAGKGIVGFLSKTSKGFKVSETYKRRGA